MVAAEGLRKRWFTVTLYVAMSVFFLVSAIMSAASYTSVVRAQSDIVLTNPVSGVQALENGSIHLTFSITLENPSKYTLHVNILSWYVQLVNGSSVIVLGSHYVGPNQRATVTPHVDWEFSYESFVSDSYTLSQVNGFINYSASQGQDYTIETLPYVDEFYFNALLGDFEHDYTTESYLNDLVTVEVTYETGVTE